MKVMPRDESGNVALQISDIQGDLGEPTRLKLLETQDGDVIVEIADPENHHALAIQFNTKRGGSRNPEISAKLRELMRLLEEKTRR